MANKEALLSFYTDYEDRLLINNIFALVNARGASFVYSFTDFLDPRHMGIVLEIMKDQKNCHIKFFGGINEAERCMACIYGDEVHIETIVPPISIITMMWRGQKLLNHRDFLGTLIGEGIKREKIGDIIIKDGIGYVVAEKIMSEYILTNINKIGGEAVSSEYTKDINDIVKSSKIVMDTVASLRLDAVVASGFGMSRGTAADFIKSGKAFVNWQRELSIAKTVKIGDAITIRGKGRIKLQDISGITKKSRYKIEIKQYI